MAFSISAPSTWNSLPVHISFSDSFFERQFKSHLFECAFTVWSFRGSTSDLLSDFWALYKYVCVFMCVSNVLHSGTVVGSSQFTDSGPSRCRRWRWHTSQSDEPRDTQWCVVLHHGGSWGGQRRLRVVHNIRCIPPVMLTEGDQQQSMH